MLSAATPICAKPVLTPARLRSGGISRRSAARKVTKSPIVRSPRLVWYMAKASTTATPDMQITCVSGVPSEETFVISSSILRIVSLMPWKRPSSYS